MIDRSISKQSYVFVELYSKAVTAKFLFRVGFCRSPGIRTRKKNLKKEPGIGIGVGIGFVCLLFLFLGGSPLPKAYKWGQCQCQCLVLLIKNQDGSRFESGLFSKVFEIFENCSFMSRSEVVLWIVGTDDQKKAFDQSGFVWLPRSNAKDGQTAAKNNIWSRRSCLAAWIGC